MTDEAWWHQSQGDPANAPISCNCRVCEEKHWPVKYDEDGNPTEFSDGVNWHRVQKRREGEMIPQSMEHTSWTGHVNHRTFQPGCEICDQQNHVSHNNWVSGCLRCAQEHLSSRPLTDWTGSATFFQQVLDKVPLSEMSEATYGGREVVESATGGKKGTKQAMATCHPDRPARTNGLCKQCNQREWAKNKYWTDEAYRERVKERSRTSWHKKQRVLTEEQREARRVRRRKQYANDPRKVQSEVLYRKHGITLDNYDVMLEQQNGVCAICSDPPPWDRRFAVDHNHDTGTIRGLLCKDCNTGIGHLKENISVLEAAIGYLIMYRDADDGDADG